MPRGGEPRVYEIVDGQQRLVTLTILACALRDLDETDGEEVLREIEPLVQTSGSAGSRGSVRLELRGRQRDFLQSCVLVEGACSEMPDVDEVGEPERRILEIREHFIAELSALEREQRLQLTHYVKTACYFVVMLTPDIDRAHRMFVVLNGRGKPLTRHDILKAEILNKVPASASGRAVEAWDRVADQLGEESFETFFSHVRTIHGHTRPPVVAGIRAIIPEVGGPEAFIDKVFEPLADAYQHVLNPRAFAAAGITAGVHRSLSYLQRLSGVEWVPAAMVAFRRFGSDMPFLARQLAEIERLAYLVRLLCLGGGKRTRRFAEVIEALQSGRVLSATEGPCLITRDERRTIAFNMRDLHGRNQQVCKLTLMRINDEISGRFNDLDPADYSVEHVLPQRIGPASPWRSLFPDVAQRETCVQSLGNLLLLTLRQNDKARNQEFARKREVYSECRGSPIEALTADVLAATSWGPAEVLTREQRLLSLIDGIWQIEIVKDPPPPPLEPSARPGRRRKKSGS